MCVLYLYDMFCVSSVCKIRHIVFLPIKIDMRPEIFAISEHLAGDL